MRRRVLLAASMLVLAGCDLQEVTLAEAEPFIVAESYLDPDRPVLVALHASAGAAHLLEADAQIRLATPDTVFGLSRVDERACLAASYHAIDREDFPGGFACYVAAVSLPDTVRRIFMPDPGELYRLSIEMPDGSRLAGSTRVPDRMHITAPRVQPEERCYLEPLTQVDVVWNRIAGAAAYVIDLRLFDVAQALAEEGIIVEDVPNPVTLRGLAISSADTTIGLPAEFGVFDRFALDADLVLALQRGVPEGIVLDVHAAAVDQNFVDWVRGGDFNPSGLIRTPSLFGDAGTGVLGSLTVDRFTATTREEERDSLPPC